MLCTIVLAFFYFALCSAPPTLPSVIPCGERTTSRDPLWIGHLKVSESGDTECIASIIARDDLSIGSDLLLTSTDCENQEDLTTVEFVDKRSFSVIQNPLDIYVPSSIEASRQRIGLKKLGGIVRTRQTDALRALCLPPHGYSKSDIERNGLVVQYFNLPNFREVSNIGEISAKVVSDSVCINKGYDFEPASMLCVQAKDGKLVRGSPFYSLTSRGYTVWGVYKDTIGYPTHVFERVH